MEKYRLTLFGKWMFIYLPFTLFANVCFNLLFSNGFTWYELMAFIFLSGFFYAGTIGLFKSIYDRVKSKIEFNRSRKRKIIVMDSLRECRYELNNLIGSKNLLTSFLESELAAGNLTEKEEEEKVSNFLDEAEKLDYKISIQKQKVNILEVEYRDLEFVTEVYRVSNINFVDSQRMHDQLNEVANTVNNRIAELEAAVRIHDEIEDSHYAQSGGNTDAW